MANNKDFSTELTNILEEYTQDMQEIVNEEVDSTAKKILKDVKAKSPRWGKKRTGEYKKGWRIVKKDEFLRTKRIVWNQEYYHRVHLLEKGHVSSFGGRAEAYPHVEPAYKAHGETMPDRIAKKIGGMK